MARPSMGKRLLSTPRPGPAKFAKPSSTSPGLRPVPPKAMPVSQRAPTTPAPLKVPAKAMPVQRTPQERLVVYADEEDGVAVKAICGTYVENGTSCGRKTFQKETDKETDQVVIYYWDDRDGPGMQGWWFGNTLAGPQVWSRCLDESMTVPKKGWKIPWDGDVKEALRVEPEADRVEKMARLELKHLQQQAPLLTLAAKKLQERARVMQMKKQVESAVQLLSELSTAAQGLKDLAVKVAAIPKPNRRMSGNEILEEIQEFSNRISDAITALNAEDVKLRKMCQEVEDEKKRQEQEAYDNENMRLFLPEVVALVDQADDEVEKALITHEILATCDEEAAEQALSLIASAASQAQKVLDDVKAGLKEKRNELQWSSSRQRGETELKRLEAQLHGAQVKLKPLKNAREEWELERRSRRIISEVEQKLILAELELDRSEDLVNSTAQMDPTSLAEIKMALKSCTEAQRVMAFHLNAPKVQKSPSCRAKLPPLESRAERCQQRLAAAAEAAQALEERHHIGPSVQEASQKLKVISEELQKLKEVLDESQGVVKAAEELNSKLQNSFTSGRIYLTSKVLEAKRLTTLAGQEALGKLLDMEKELESLCELRSQLSDEIGERRLAALLKEAEAQVILAEREALALKSFEFDKETSEELREATQKSVELETETKKQVSEARRLVACRQIEARNRKVSSSFTEGLQHLQERILQVETEITEQRKRLGDAQQQMKGRRATEEVQQKVLPLEEALRGFEELAEQLAEQLAEKEVKAGDVEVMKKLRTAEVKLQELQVKLKPLIRQLDMAKVDATHLRTLEERSQRTLTKLKRHSEDCYVQDVMCSCKKKLESSEAACDEAEKALPRGGDPVEAATALTAWEKNMQAISSSVTLGRSEMSRKLLSLQRLDFPEAHKTMAANISEMEGLLKRLSDLRQRGSEERRLLFRSKKPPPDT